MLAHKMTSPVLLIDTKQGLELEQGDNHLATAALGLQVTLSSLNRHAVATRADIGLPKATVLAQHFRKIFPEIQVQARYSLPFQCY